MIKLFPVFRAFGIGLGVCPRDQTIHKACRKSGVECKHEEDPKRRPFGEIFFCFHVRLGTMWAIAGKRKWIRDEWAGWRLSGRSGRRWLRGRPGRRRLRRRPGRRRLRGNGGRWMGLSPNDGLAVSFVPCPLKRFN